MPPINKNKGPGNGSALGFEATLWASGNELQFTLPDVREVLPISPIDTVAQASSPASAPGVPPGVRAGGETPSELAAETAALRRQNENCCRKGTS